jgi:hypothetical protein
MAALSRVRPVTCSPPDKFEKLLRLDPLAGRFQENLVIFVPDDRLFNPEIFL